MNSNAFGGYTELINKRLKELGLKPRKDAVVINSFVVGSDKAFFDSLPKMQQYSFFSDCAKFFEERYGQENVISAVVHLGETTPHMHLNLIPITPDGRLCSKDLFDKPKLQQLQKDFYEAVGKKYGLQRGKEGSQAKHLSTAEYKAKKIIEEAEEIRRENQVFYRRCPRVLSALRIMRISAPFTVIYISQRKLYKYYFIFAYIIHRNLFNANQNVK